MNRAVHNHFAPALLLEERLLVSAARIDLDREDRDAIRAILNSRPNWAKILKDSLTLGVQPLLYKHLSQDPLSHLVPPEVLLHLKESYLTQSMRSLRLYAQINQIMAAIEPCGIKIVLLKGAFLAMRVYGDTALRPMSDIDILCKTSDEESVRGILNGLGYYQDRSIYHTPVNEAVQNVGKHHQLPFRRENANRVELHTKLFPDDYGHPVDMDGLWETFPSCKFNGFDIKCFAPDYQILYLCLHLYHHIAAGLVAFYWFCDIHEMIRLYRDRIDWSRLFTTARSLGAADQVLTVFDLLRTHWNTPLPQNVLPASSKSGICLASILENRLYEKQNEIKLLSEYAQEFKTIFQIKGWARRFQYIAGLIIPSPPHLKFRYKLDHPLAIGLCYFLLPFIRCKNLGAGLFYKILFRLSRKNRDRIPEPNPEAGHDNDQN